MLMNFCIANNPRCQMGVQVFWLFQQTFTYEKIKGNIMKRQKNSALKHFSLPRYSEKWTA